jgi:hypothetical protein
MEPSIWVPPHAASKGKPLCVTEAAVQQLLLGVPLLSALDAIDRERIARVLTVVELECGQPVVTAGEDGDAMYFVEQGVSQAEVAGKAVMSYGRGDYFGELSLLTNEKRKATVRATSAAGLRCLRLSRADFEAEALDCAGGTTDRRQLYQNRLDAIADSNRDGGAAFESYEEESGDSEPEDPSYSEEIDSKRDADGAYVMRSLKPAVVRAGPYGDAPVR